MLPSTSSSTNITSPLNESHFTAGTDIVLSADAFASGVGITKVEFYEGNNLIFTEHKAPYYNKWRNVPAGNCSFTAKVTDGNGNVIASQPVQVTLTGPLARSIVKDDKLTLAGTLLALKINPNPVAGVLNISLDGLQTNRKSTISIISASGVVVKTINARI